MSSSVDASSEPLERHTPPPEAPQPDGIHGRLVIVIALGALAVMACGVAVAWTIATSLGEGDQAGRWGAPSDEMQAIEMSLLPRADAEHERRASAPETPSEPQRFEREAQARLSTYGYSDRQRGTVHIPLARAKQLYLERERTRAGTAPAPAPASRRAP